MYIDMEDDDDFDYVPLKKIKRKVPEIAESSCTKQSKRKKPTRTKNGAKNKKTAEDSTNSEKSTTKQRKKTPKHKTPVRERKKYDGHCPKCQMPFSIFIIETPSWHASECEDCFHPKSECPEGAECDCTIQSHYWKYSHSQLAEYRVNKTKTTEKLQKGKIKLNFDEHIKVSEASSCDTNVNKSKTVNLTDEILHSSQKITDNMCTGRLDLTSNQSPIKNSNDLEEAFIQETYCSQKSTEGFVNNVDSSCKLQTNSKKDLHLKCDIEEGVLNCDTANGELNGDTGDGELNGDAGDGELNCDTADSELNGDTADCDLNCHTDGEFNGDTENGELNCDTENGELNDDTENDVLNCDTEDIFLICEDEKVENDCLDVVEDTVLSGKSLSDIDADEDSNSQQLKSFFKDYKKRKGLNENTESNNGGKLYQEDVKCDDILLNQGSEEEDLKDEKHSSDVEILEADDNETQYSPVCIGQKSMLPSSQESLKSHSKQNIYLTTSSKQSTSQGSKLKNNKKPSSDLKKQTSLFSFFTGSSENKIENLDSSMTDNKTSSCSNTGNFLNVSSKVDAAIANQIYTNGKHIKVKNVNDILMTSLKKSVSQPNFDSTKTGLKNSLVKNASDISMNKTKKANCEKIISQQKPHNGKWNIKDENEFSSFNSGVQISANTEASGKPKNYRYCPFYKKIPDTGFTVDAFCYGEVPGCKAYFLSHFHYDHYRGLTKQFSQPIYCSKVTGNLVRSRIGIRPDIVHDLPMNIPCTVNGVEVILLEANHCPGSVLFLFKTQQGKLILHTGDFRADPSMEQIPCLQNVPIQQLYLDTTYCDPKYAFPPQKQVVEFGLSLVEKLLAEKPSTLVVCGSYTIGKERIFTALAKALDCKICVQRDKFKILECLEDVDLTKRLSLDFNDSFLHVLPMGKLKVEDLEKHVSKLKKNFDQIVAIEPTGWTFNNKMISLEQIRPRGNHKIKIYGLPYSEHSSYLELKRFVQYINPTQILPTVNNGNPASRRKMEELFSAWMEENHKQPESHQTSLAAWTK